MGRLKLIGEPEGGGTDDHSALSNLDYANSGHSGFVPSEGEALIDILRLNQNVIRDSDGNDRITLSTASPHHTLTGDARTTGRAGVHSAIDSAAFLGVSPNSEDLTNQSLIKCLPTNCSVGNGFVYGFLATPVVKVNAATTPTLLGLSFNLAAGYPGTGATAILRSVYNQLQLILYSGTVSEMCGYRQRQPVIMGTPVITVSRGFHIENQGGNAYIADVESLKIDDITLNTGHRYLLEAGPATPYLRLVGGGNPPANRSNLYLKFGSTLYRVVKSGSYMTLEAA